MDFISVNQAAEQWGVTPRVVRGYCKAGRIPGAQQEGSAWRIPADAEKPARKKRAGTQRDMLLQRLRMEKDAGMPGGIYHKVQVDFTYNSNHIEGSRLTHDQTRFIFETNTIGTSDALANTDDCLHLQCLT